MEGMSTASGSLSPGSERRIQVEALVLAVWREVFEIDELQLDADFFELGGNSLLAVKLTTRLGEVADVEVPIDLLFDHSTVSALAMAIETERWRSTTARA
jgi:acyl carrier protein